MQPVWETDFWKPPSANASPMDDEAFRLPPAEFERLYEEMLRQLPRDPETG